LNLWSSGIFLLRISERIQSLGAEQGVAKFIDIAAPHDAIGISPSKQVFDALGHSVDAVDPRKDARVLQGKAAGLFGRLGRDSLVLAPLHHVIRKGKQVGAELVEAPAAQKFHGP
jgi:hypothetical protein